MIQLRHCEPVLSKQMCTRLLVMETQLFHSRTMGQDTRDSSPFAILVEMKGSHSQWQIISKAYSARDALDNKADVAREASRCPAGKAGPPSITFRWVGMMRIK